LPSFTGVVAVGRPPTISANSGGTIVTYTYDYHNRLTEVTQGGKVICDSYH
jgi:YD repeat-containing protein